MNDIVINKIQSIQRCIKRAREEYATAGNSFGKNLTNQDAAILNLTRACEQAIDLANYVLKIKKLGVPNRSSDSFKLLAENGILSHELSEKLVRMTGFRNTAIHQYQELNIDIIVSIITKDVEDLLEFADAVMDAMDI
jgi:uncharacterized protein YutE (UPF0331/DUF86 family)